MDSFLEEYGFIIVSTICASIVVAGFVAGLDQDGFLGKSIINFVNSIIGGNVGG